MHVATAFRWRPTALAGQETDVVRVRDDGDVHLVVLANGFECGFSTCWPPASRLLLDLFLEAWSGSTQPVPDRLRDAFEQARARFTAEAPALITPEADFPDDLPAGVLLAAAIVGTTAHLAWISGDVALLVRDGRVVDQTTPHTLRERLGPTAPDVLVRYLGPIGDLDPPSFATFTGEAGDTIVLISKSAANVVVALDRDPKRLAELAFGHDDVPYVAVAVIRYSSSSSSP